MIDDILCEVSMCEIQSAFCTLLILDSWVNDPPFSGANTAGFFNTYKILETLESLITPPTENRLTNSTLY